MALLRVTTQINGLGGSPGYSRQHFIPEGEAGDADAGFSVDAVVAMWAAMAGMLYVGVTYVVEPEVLVIDQTTGQTTGVIVTDGGSVTGTSSDTPLPWSTQGLLQLRTGLYVGGREVRGRVFVPGVTAVANALGRPTSTARNLLNAGGEGLLLDGVSFPAVLSKNIGVGVQAITGWNEWAYLGSRRD